MWRVSTVVSQTHVSASDGGDTPVVVRWFSFSTHCSAAAGCGVWLSDADDAQVDDVGYATCSLEVWVELPSPPAAVVARVCVMSQHLIQKWSKAAAMLSS
ncbi:Hypothetical predicted protein, partial [Pelobates cultripes]